MKRLITNLLNFRQRKRQSQYSQLLQRRLNQQQQHSYQQQHQRSGIFKNLLIISIAGLAGFIILLQQLQLQFYKSDNYVVSVQTPLPTATPLPTYTPQPISIIIATPMVSVTATQTIDIPSTVSQIIPTLEPTFILEPSPQPTSQAQLNEITAPEYNFGNANSTNGTIVTDNDVFLPPDKSNPPLSNLPLATTNDIQNGVIDTAFLYQFIIALLQQLGILQLVSANIQLIVIVGIAFLILALFLR